MKRFILLFAIISMVAANIVLPVSASAQVDSTPNTPLYLFRDTIENHTTGTVSTSSLVNGLWKPSEVLGGTGNYAVMVESYTRYNKVIALTPSAESEGNLCVLNLIKDIDSSDDYVYSADVKATGTMAGIRLADPTDDTACYELAILWEDGVPCTRFSKVPDATSQDPAAVPDWSLAQYKRNADIAENTWVTLSVAKIDNSFYWSVCNRETGASVSCGKFDDLPMFTDTARLQLFAYGVEDDQSPALFDNIDAKKIGAELYASYDNEDYTNIEVSWINMSNNSPLIATADYDENGRVVNVQTFNISVANSEMSQYKNGYYISDVPLYHSGTEKKLFVWDSNTLQPMFQPSSHIEIEKYEVSADKYIYQSDRAIGSRFSDGGGIRFDSIGIVNVSADAELYINGEQYTANALSDDIIDKFLGNAQGIIRFEKKNKNDLCYTRIYADYYVTGIVRSVTHYNETTTVLVETIVDAPYAPSINIAPYLTIEVSNNAINTGASNPYIEKNDSEILLKQLLKNDVLAVKLNPNDVTTGSSLHITDPENIQILATDKTIKGMVLDYDDEYRTYTVGDGTYKYIGYDANDRKLNIAVTYTLSLDPFDRIISECIAVPESVKFAIFESYSADTGKVSLLLANGSTASYYLGNGEIDAAGVNAMEGTDVLDRVVTYWVSSNTVMLYSVDPADRTTLGRYNATTGKLGSVPITDGVNIIDAEQYVSEGDAASITDYSKFDAGDLKSQIEYEGAAYKSGDVYSFVVITQAGTEFTEDSRFAVIVKDPSMKMRDGEVCVGANAYYKGEEVVLYWETTNADAVTVGEGDVIFFTTDADGFVKNSYTIYTREGGVLANTLPEGSYVDDDWDFGFADTTADIKVVAGVVAKAKSNSITFGVPVDGLLNGNVYEKAAGDEGMFTFGIADECNVYIYDGAIESGIASNYRGYSVLDDASAIVESDLIEQQIDGEDVDYVYDMTQGSVHNAVALTVNGDVVCIFVMYPEIY